MNAQKEHEGAICAGCGNRVGPVGCCATILSLQAMAVTMRHALDQIAKTEGQTLLGECCTSRTCRPAADGSGCAYRAGANRAFNSVAHIAARALSPRFDSDSNGFRMEAAL